MHIVCTYMYMYMIVGSNAAAYVSLKEEESQEV